MVYALIGAGPVRAKQNHDPHGFDMIVKTNIK